MADVFECDWARSIYLDPNDPFKAKDLVSYAMHLRMYGERAPGGKENWKDWEIVAEDFLRATSDVGDL